jgi:hypothetical protein
MSQRDLLLGSCRCFLIERSGAPTAAPAESEHGTGDPEEPAARKPTGERVRAGERHFRAPVEELGKRWRARIARAGGTSENNPAARWRGVPWDRSPRGSHIDSFRDCPSACQPRRRERARP